jgi:SAM-dependent methyltransferase
MFKPKEISDHLVEKDGIWYLDKVGDISYPEKGNDLCYQVEDESFWFAHRNQIIQFVFKQYPPKGIIYDVGGGNGYVTRLMQEMGYTAVLIEPGSEGIVNAQYRGVKNRVRALLDDQHFKPLSMDNVCLFDVLEHIEYPDQFLKMLHAIMKNEGQLYITVPAYKCLWSDEDELAGHYTRYTRKRLIKLLKANDYKIIYSSYFFSVLAFPIFLFRTVPSWFKRNKYNKASPDISEHKINPSLISKVFSAFLHWENKFLNSGKNILFGSSIIMVCKKISHE